MSDPSMPTPAPTSDPALQGVTRSDSESPLDVQALMASCMSNLGLVKMVVDKFESQARSDMLSIVEGLKNRDAERIAKVAHALKGAAGAVSAKAVWGFAARIEKAGRGADLEEVENCIAALQSEVDRCLAWLPSMMNQSGASANPSAAGKDHP